VLILATVLGCAGTSSWAASAARIWDGTMQIIGQSSQCDAAGDFTGSIPAYYRAKLKATDPRAGIMTGNGDKQLQLQEAGTNHTMSGTGTYKGTFMDGASGVISWSGGTYNLTFAAPVTATARYVKVTGTVTNFAGVTGCQLTIRAGFIQRLPADN
jgi:hypothetical protein